jgi:hypothetical protein
MEAVTKNNMKRAAIPKEKAADVMAEVIITEKKPKRITRVVHLVLSRH